MMIQATTLGVADWRCLRKTFVDIDQLKRLNELHETGLLSYLYTSTSRPIPNISLKINDDKQ